MMNCNFYNPNVPYSTMKDGIKKGEMRVKGIGTIKLQPNIASVSLGVITEDRSLEIAQKENAQISTQVLSGLMHMGIPEKDIMTGSYTIDSQYDYIEGKQIFRGYKVTNTFIVTIRDIDKVGAIIDESVKNGVNSVNNIKFTVDDISIYYNRALQLAIKDTIVKSRQIAETLRIKVNRTPSNIVEEGYDQMAPEPTTLKMYASVTPIMPGEIQIIARIESVFNYNL
ncbi:hypothetical protein BD780_004250 [Clostridium tetanomorphum]|uniref:SIMPL domain-containing protein n=1 Tax=Clostridium tetanomorphum TaxID=1553 RepID=A0A923IZS7_CLOTT|nr:SIMPL domain-containing protein [Clostridium tetanomorphum]KAJ51968.1 periplasmic immunogenic protein [Clostridium tetanomorphum DSM 665]MBC2396969.1 SIMPL domain-containing protein [Clostridium tetanomorphum]MBP1862888.1 uncharacterized protein YggE [Clostridium tetanomorphum]NRS87025.1 hypothetical protein [Clostridium tetanomorphum]NRZ99189.1 hypothetical protein [Clostridium tetanomorphum]